MPIKRRWYVLMHAVPSGHEYVGPCLCGFGPREFYSTPEDMVMHASQIFTPAPALMKEPTEEEKLEMLEDEADMLEEELAQIKKRIEELEKEVK